MKIFLNSPGKMFTIKVIVFFFGFLFASGQVAAQAQCNLACNDLIQIAVPANGSIEFLPDDIGEGDLLQFCPNGVFQAQVMINNTWQNPTGNFVFDSSHVGNTYFARLRDLNSGNSCWGSVEVVAGPALLDTVRLQLCARYWGGDRPINGATLVFQPSNPSFPYSPIVFTLDSTQSCADLTVVMSDYLPGTSFGYSITSVPDTSFLNGVNILDMCKISKHILGLEPLPSPYAMFAADANKSGSITTFDIVEFRKLMLGVYTDLPNNTPWRFIADYCEFTNPNNPFQNTCQSGISAVDLSAMNGGIAKVWALKVGDVDGDASLNGALYVPPGSLDSSTLLLPQGQLTAGAPVAIPVSFEEDLNFGSLQIRFFLDPALAKFDSISDGAIDVNAAFAHFDPLTASLKFAAVGYNSYFAPAEIPLFFIHLTPLQSADLTNVLKVVHNDPDLSNFAIGAGCGPYYELGSANVGFVATQSPELQGLRILPPSPNPFRTHTYLEIELESTETAVLEVVDLSGRVVFSEEKNLSSGLYRWEIPGSALANGNLAFWRLQVGAQTTTGKLVRK